MCWLMSKSYYRVSFLSNSQRHHVFFADAYDVKELLPCFLFKQFTTDALSRRFRFPMSKSYYRVSFLSNSQHTLVHPVDGFLMSKSYYRVSFLSNSQQFLV